MPCLVIHSAWPAHRQACLQRRPLCKEAPMLRNILAVIGGYLATGLLIFSTDQLFAALIPGFKAMTTPPLYYFLISVVTDALYSIIGGFLCARIAHPPFRRNAMFSLILLGELVGVVSTIFLWKIVPHWWSFALLLLYPPAVWLGFKLQSRQARLHQAAA